MKDEEKQIQQKNGHQAEDAAGDRMNPEQFLARRKAAGLKIDPDTAEVDWSYVRYIDDPYDLLHCEPWRPGTAYFARSPGSDVWVWFGDLPDTTLDALWRKHEAKLMFPTGLDVPEDKDVEKWLAIRKKAGLEIDPDTAEVKWCFAETVDPYGIDPDLPEEWSCVGKELFAWAPASGVWVAFRDLPEATGDALRRKLWGDEAYRVNEKLAALLEDGQFSPDADLDTLIQAVIDARETV